MNNNNFEQFKSALRNIEMSKEETDMMRVRLAQFMERYTGEAPSVESPFVRHGFILRPLQAVALALVLVLSGGGGLAFASQNALPGDALYGFKVNVAEEIMAFVQRGPEAKATYEIERATERLNETTELALAGRLDENAKESLSKHIKAHTAAARKHTKDVRDEQLQTELALTTKLESSLTPRTEFLKEIKEGQDLNGELGTILAVTEENIEIAKASKQQAADALTETSNTVETTREDVVLVKLNQVNGQLSILSELALSEPVSITVSSVATAVTDLSLVDKKTITLAEEAVAVEDLVKEAQTRIDEGHFSEALILLESAETRASSTLTLVELKKTIQVLPKTEVEKTPTATAPVVSETTQTSTSVVASIPQES